jgi:glutathione synthase/RimK-type ligase-like ATP-grasp enzyme
MIAIQPVKGGFDTRWIAYCKSKSIPYKIVDCYKHDIIEQLKGCDALMFQFYQGNRKDILMAKQLLFSLEQAGICVFPDFRTSWHFDDKVGQKYLLEAAGVPVAPSWVFYDKAEALQWADQCTYPKVFKLRGGSSSDNVKLVRSKGEARKLICKSFGRGFSQYDPVSSLKERIRRYRVGKSRFTSILVGLGRFIVPPPVAKIKGRHRGYAYFQEFIPGNDHDIRVVVVGDKAFAIKRLVRVNDFRASGSGNILYEKSLFDESLIRLSFDISDKLKAQCVAFDFVHDGDKPLVVEISYGFSPKGYDPCPGYWDKSLTWHEGAFDPYGWMIDDLIRCAESKVKK